MQKVVSLQNFGDVKIGDTLAIFQMWGVAALHDWVIRGWAEVVDIVPRPW